MAIRWNWSRWSPSASATIDLMTSAWLQTTVGGVRRRGDRSSHGWPRARVPACRAAPRHWESDGRRLGLDDLPERVAGQLLRAPAGPVAVVRLAQAFVHWTSSVVDRPARSNRVEAALQRRRNDRGQRDRAKASRHRAACSTPRSSRCRPGVHPARTGPVSLVRPCRTSRTVVTARASLSPAWGGAGRRDRGLTAPDQPREDAGIHQRRK